MLLSPQNILTGTPRIVLTKWLWQPIKSAITRVKSSPAAQHPRTPSPGPLDQASLNYTLASPPNPRQRKTLLGKGAGTLSMLTACRPISLGCTLPDLVNKKAAGPSDCEFQSTRNHCCSVGVSQALPQLHLTSLLWFLLYSDSLSSFRFGR